jgi:Raf kinase inhibitor-like YbhB/YbcL family protein
MTSGLEVRSCRNGGRPPGLRATLATLLVGAAAVGALAAQNPPAAGQRAGGAAPPQGQGRGRASIQLMTLTTMGWADGGVIPAKFSQAGHDVSPALAWTNAPDTAASFTLIVHDLDAPIGSGTDDVLQWMVWNIPGAARSLPEGVPQGAELADGTRQISVTGPNYRGPAAPATGPAHHYVFELFALDAKLDVAPVGAAPAATRAAVAAAMAGHIRGKATMIGLYKRQ